MMIHKSDSYWKHGQIVPRVPFDPPLATRKRGAMGFKDADSKKRLGRRVEQAVTDAGYGSPDEFARGIGLPRSTFFKLRKGTLDPRFSTLMKIARGLGVSLSTLVGDSPEASLAGTSGSVRPLGDAAEPPVRLVNRKAQVKVNFSIT